MPAVQETVARVREIDVDKYKYGFITDIELVTAPKGLTEDDWFASSRPRRASPTGCSTGGSRPIAAG